MKIFGVMNTLDIFICKDAEDASMKGHNYRSPEFKPIEIEKVVVLREGTVEGNSTVDLVLKDESGQKFVVMLTGRLIKSIPC